MYMTIQKYLNELRKGNFLIAEKMIQEIVDKYTNIARKNIGQRSCNRCSFMNYAKPIYLMQIEI